ncbi:cadherin-8-like [Tachysurus fulvidraco]|uniref:cadherin-8-like n=1 Tax=Tachysurus fulvidraco TaxID=1234273 RepID=UPI001FED4AE9|nr:cadherin-8-like [Tachysurus fulvidraco]
MPKRREEMQRDVWTRILLAWITCVCFGSSVPFVHQSQSLETRPSSESETSHPEGRRVLQRSKRGWVWNQMFVLEEFSGPDPILVGRLHTDLDVGNKNIRYVLAGEGAGTIFAINELTGDIHAMKRLDREEKAEYTLTAQVINRDNNEPLEPPSEFIIKVQDINDNPPQFIEGPYQGSVPEMSPVASVEALKCVVLLEQTCGSGPVLYAICFMPPTNKSHTMMSRKLKSRPRRSSFIFYLDNSISILAKHDSFRRQKQEVYLLPIVVSDDGNPPMSSTNTLSIRVCGCSKDGVVQSCNVEAFVLPIGLSMGALIAILACIILLLVIVVLFVTLRRHKSEPLIIKDEEDVRENIITYDDEGGGEEDTEAFDIATLQNPDGINGFLPRKDIKPELSYSVRAGLRPAANGVDIDEFINVRLHEADNDPTAPPYDSIQIYGYEGRGSMAGSLSSLETSSSDSDQNFDYLREWGPRFRRLGELYSVGESDKET